VEILKAWLQGTTCNRPACKRSILFENDTHIVLKHNAHAEYCGRGSGTQNCEAYASLYCKAAFDLTYRHCRVTLYGDGALLRWMGRISKAKVLAECKTIGVTFVVLPLVKPHD
jgi:hypothetical protein